MQRSISFLVVLILTFKGEIFAQKKFSEKVEKKFTVPAFYTKKSGYAPVFINGHFSAKTVLSPFILDPFARSMPAVSSVIPRDLFLQQLGFVCKKEWQLEKASSIPFRFRLGSLAYTDYMERKPNALKP